ncbi:MAG TPA: RpiB/LacA/LacB family sugar-phosphate isomerase [Gemmatimonadaceae bacterium]|nr:RpiB/LacA/LacB family sugar-phosphate isomerase [Gemmatimonadaceae bacterium]
MSGSIRETIPIASDHAGVELKGKLIDQLRTMGYAVEDLGTNSEDPSDYPDFAHPLAKEVSTGQAKRGILLCGSGIGVDIVANRYPHVRAALSWMPEIAELSRRHNDSNVLVIPARFVSDHEASEIVDKWMNTEFEGGRHARRVNKIDDDEAESVDQGDGNAS